jgi:hypothetical protein
MSRRRSIVKRSRRRKSKHTKPNKSKKSRHGSRKNKSRGFGSIYGLQAPSKAYAGVYPFTLKTHDTMPNLRNVERNFTVGGG